MGDEGYEVLGTGKEFSYLPITKFTHDQIQDKF